MTTEPTQEEHERQQQDDAGQEINDQRQFEAYQEGRNLNNLKKEISYKWRVQSFSKWKPEASCVAYLDSRLVQDLLDDVVGADNWQDKYYECKNNLFCSIGIRIDGRWVWKTDCGTESNVDKQKGEASDAFKRAAVKWGIGRFLYSMEFKKLPANVKKENNNQPHVVDGSGKQVWNLTNHINSMNPALLPPSVINDITKFIDVWEGGKVGSDLIVTWRGWRYVLTVDQLVVLRKSPKYQGKK